VYPDDFSLRAQRLATTVFHGNRAGLNPDEEPHHHFLPQCFTQRRIASFILAAHRKYLLCQIHAIDVI
jgi:hypothetical protein